MSASGSHRPKRSFGEALRRGETLLSAWSTLPCLSVVEEMAAAGYGAITFDMQHGLHDFASVAAGIMAVRTAGCFALVRLPLNDITTAPRVLDAGAQGLIAPMINRAQDAKAVVDATRFPPAGQRSWGPRRAMRLDGVTDRSLYLAEANRWTEVFAMIETPAAVAALDEILLVDGLDGVFVGPSDLSIGLSEGQRVEPSAAAVQAVIREIAEKSLSAGKLAGIFTNSLDEAKAARTMGFHLIALGVDTAFLVEGASRAVEGFDRF